MPETYGLPEPEPTAPDRVRAVAEQVIAGKSVVRVVMLYMVIFTGLALGPGLWPAAFIGIIAAVLLMATDSDLTA